MVLNIFPRREKPASAPVIEERILPEPSPEALEEPARKPTRRGSRGGRGRRKPADGAVESTAEQAEEPQQEPAEGPKPATRRTRATAARQAVDGEVTPAEEPAPVKRASSRKPAAERAEKAPEQETEPAPEKAPAAKRGSAKPAVNGTGDLAALLRVVEAQGKQIEQLAKAHEDFLKRGPAGGPIAPPARVGIFVDAANVELAIDRLRTRVDWKKVLNLLSRTGGPCAPSSCGDA